LLCRVSFLKFSMPSSKGLAKLAKIVLLGEQFCYQSSNPSSTGFAVQKSEWSIFLIPSRIPFWFPTHSSNFCLSYQTILNTDVSFRPFSKVVLCSTGCSLSIKDIPDVTPVLCEKSLFRPHHNGEISKRKEKCICKNLCIAK